MNKTDIIMVFLFIWFFGGSTFMLITLVTKAITCKEVEKCKDNRCLFSYNCPKYDRHITQEEYEDLIRLINNYKKLPEKRFNEY